MSHWYDPKTQQPKYEIERSDGKGLRPTTLRDAKKYRYVPSVTTIIASASKQGLDTWKMKQLLNVVENYKNFIGEKEDWREQLIAIMKERLDKVTKRGTVLHDSLESIFTKGLIDVNNENEVFVTPIIEFIEREIRFKHIFKWKPETSFAYKKGFGGKIDLHSECGNVIIDFKSKDSEDLSRIELYDDYPMQLAAYREGLNINNVDFTKAKCYNLFFSNSKKGEIKLVEWDEDKLQRALKMFHCLLEYWKLSNNYESGWE